MVYGMPFLCKGFCKLPPTRELSRRLKVSRVVITIGTAQALDLMLRTLAPLESMAIKNPDPEPIHRLIRIHQIKPKAILPYPISFFWTRGGVGTGLATCESHFMIGTIR